MKKVAIPGDPEDPHGIHRALVDFIEHLKVTGYAQRSIEDTSIHLAAFAAWLGERGIVRPSEVTKPILERYQRALYHRRKKDGTPLSFRTQRIRLLPVKMLFRFLTRANRILFNPASEIELPRIEKRLPAHVLSQAEAELVLNQPDIKTQLGLRYRAIMETFYSSGIRRQEMINLKLWDLDRERGVLMVRQGKGKKDRMTPIGDRALAWIERYLDEVRPALVVEPDAHILFLTADGKSISPDHMTQIATSAVEASGIGKKGSCHLFRHTMATLMLEGGADIRFVQQMLGHAEIKTTQIYTQVAIKKLKQVHSATHPGATLERHRSPFQPGFELDPKEDSLSSLAAEAEEEQDDDNEEGEPGGLFRDPPG